MPDVFRPNAHTTVTVDLRGDVTVMMSDGKVQHKMAVVSPHGWPALIAYADHLRDERLGVFRTKAFPNFVVYANVAPTTNPERIMVLDETSGDVTYFEEMPVSSDIHRIPARVARLYYLQAQVPDAEPAIQGLTQDALDALNALP